MSADDRAGTRTHRWERSQRFGVIDSFCSVCGMERWRPYTFSPGFEHRLPGRLAIAAYRAIVPRQPLRLSLVEPVHMLFVRWPRGGDSEGDCMLAREFRGSETPFLTETRILLACPGERLTDWAPLFRERVEGLLSIAAAKGCSRCRARPGEWCKTSSHHGVPALHRDRTAAKEFSTPAAAGGPHVG